MKKSLFILFWIVYNVVSAQSGNILKLEEQISSAERLAFVYPDSSLIILKKLEPKINDGKLKSKLLLAKGSAYSVKHLSSEALNFGLESLFVSQREKDSLMIVNALGFIGNQYYILKLNKKAIHYLNKAETIIDYLDDNSLQQVTANIYFIKALVYKDNLDSEFAIRYFDKAIKEYKKSNNKSTLLNINITKIQKAYSLLDIAKTDESEAIFKEVIKDAELHKVSEIHSYAMIGLAASYEMKKEYQKANIILLETEKQIGYTKNIGMLTEIYDALSQNYLSQNNQDQYIFYSDKLENILLKNEKIEQKSFNDILEKSIKQRKIELDNNQKLFNISVIFIFLFTIGIFFIIKRRINRLKSTKNQF